MHLLLRTKQHPTKHLISAFSGVGRAPRVTTLKVEEVSITPVIRTALIPIDPYLIILVKQNKNKCPTI